MRESILIAGLEQSGKTYFSEKLADSYIKTGKTAIIYNVGKDSDFSDAIICEPVSIETMFKHSRNRKDNLKIKVLNSLELFKDERTGKIYHFKDFRKLYAGKKVKIYRHQNERYLIKAFFKYVYDSLLIFDDNRASTRQGLGHEQIELFSRKNHAGLKYANGKQGLDLAFIYHNLDTVPGELFDYITRAILFSLNRVPNTKINNPEFWDIIEDAINDLKTLPKYSYKELILRGHPEIITKTYINQ